MTESDLLEQPCNKSDNTIEFVTTACSKLVTTTGNKQCEHNFSTACEQICNNLCVVPNLLTTWDKQCEHNLLTACWQTCYIRKNAQVVTGLQASCYRYLKRTLSSKSLNLCWLQYSLKFCCTDNRFRAFFKNFGKTDFWIYSVTLYCR
jgi:hypothetical protein